MLEYVSAVVLELLLRNLGKLRDLTENIWTGVRDPCDLHSSQVEVGEGSVQQERLDVLKAMCLIGRRRFSIEGCFEC